jgi:dolichol-phosphate mannosyltransferase
MIAVSIPCFKVKDQILAVLQSIPKDVQRIYVVDDCCPENTGDWVTAHCSDPRVRVLKHNQNQGVGGATLTGFTAAQRDGATIVVKLDGDGQMAAEEIPRLIKPILLGHADYCKGNRFYALQYLVQMPTIRLLGNSVLSFINKVSSGYWKVMDPTNGFVAIHVRVLSLLPVDEIAKGYFFESDMLYQLNIVRATIVDVPMPAHYGEEKSNLRISRVAVSFPARYVACFLKRIFYNYFLRDFNLGSAQFVGSVLLLTGGGLFGLQQWIHNSQLDRVTPTGTIMLAVLPMLVGFQLLLAAVNYDILNEPKNPVHKLLGD